jgi:hypothetical protein
MDFNNIIDLPEKKRKKKNRKNYYFLISISIMSMGTGLLFDSSNEFFRNSFILLSAVFFVAYLTMNFIHWEEKQYYHFIQFIGNIALTGGLMLKILEFPYDNLLIIIAIILIFLSYFLSFFKS